MRWLFQRYVKNAECPSEISVSVFACCWVDISVRWRVTGITSMWIDVVRHYIRSARFAADVICILPLHSPCTLVPNICEGSIVAFLRFNRLIKMYKVIIHIHVIVLSATLTRVFQM